MRKADLAEKAAELEGHRSGLQSAAAGIFAAEVAAISDGLLTDLTALEDRLEVETKRRLRAEQPPPGKCGEILLSGDLAELLDVGKVARRQVSLVMHTSKDLTHTLCVCMRA